MSIRIGIPFIRPAAFVIPAVLLFLLPAAEASAQDGDPDRAVITGVVPGPVAAADMFIKIEGIDGESVDASHDKWIDVLSVDWGSTGGQPGAAAGGPPQRMASPTRRAQPGRMEISDLSLTKTFDKSSPKLMEACAKGKQLPNMIIELTTTEDGRTPYIRYELTNVMVTSYSISTADGGVPMESVTLNFAAVKWDYIEQAQRGNVETTWKVEKGEK